ncbi:hypothetical protein [Sphingomonas sp. PAMC 26621]|uniref:hypothetical protein n=1 Tax=Sphingomonas sp. PAMC 26621 TaxID=1112213 RepID=UPI0014791D9B|nr:hypothetical protein [Sphingomonas sp. PAMC 26621]
MVESKALPLSHVCPPMAVLVSGQGWSLVQSDGILGYNTQAAIEKDGIVISYSNSKGEQDYGVRLACAVHPALSPELYRHPALIQILAAIGIQAGYDNITFETDKNLQAIKSYLMDPLIWKENVKTTATSLLKQYKKWRRGSDTTRNLAKSLAGRHPWVKAGKVPTIAYLIDTERLSLEKVRHSVSGIIFGAVGIGMVIAHYWR